MARRGSVVTCQIDFDDARHEAWAEMTWRSLDATP
jgi:hypothetical protein